LLIREVTLMRLREEVSAREVTEIDPKLFIGRVEAARELLLTVGGIRYYEPVWFAESKVRCEGVIYYERKVFEAFRASRPDNYVSAAECFRLFMEGHSPHSVVRQLKHPRPMMVRKLYQEHLEQLSFENCVIIRFDPGLDMPAWKGAHALPQHEPIHSEYVRRAIELVAFDEDYRQRCLYAVRTYEEEQKRTRAAARRLERADQADRVPKRGRPRRATDPSRSCSAPSPESKRARSRPRSRGDGRVFLDR
jgi:hypothetical protein